MRVTHRLSRNAEQSTPAIRLYLDTECNTTIAEDGAQLQTLNFGWIRRERRQMSHGKVILSSRYHRFATADEAWQIVEGSALINQLCYVYCHNWDYDGALIEMDGQAKARGWTCTRWARQKHFILAQFRQGRRSILFVDTLNYWPGSVEALGEAIGIGKLVVPASGDTAEQWDTYCRRDVDIIAVLMHSLFDLATSQGWGRFKPTIAGLAWHAYRHRFMAQSPLVIADDRLSALERRSYHGGRTECFNLALQDGPIYQLDVNSMYPSVMRDFAYPLAKLRSGKRLDLGEYNRLRERFLIVADCVIKADEPVYPVRHEGRLIFPTGSFATTLTTAEIDYAHAHGHLRSIDQHALYQPADLFSGYVDNLHALRREYARKGDRPLELACKLMLNSLYGKFGQLGQRWDVCPYVTKSPYTEFTYDCLRNGRDMRHVVRYGQVWHLVREGESQDSIPSIAAHVTAYARMRLWHFMAIAGRDNVLYCDTDSLFVNAQGARYLIDHIDSSQLGKLKLVDEYEWFWAHGPKDYETNVGERIKGVRRQASKLADGVYAQDRFTSYDQMLASGVDGQIKVTTERKHLERCYLKGIVDKDGSVSPLILTLD